jgi:hypothetical protein
MMVSKKASQELRHILQDQCGCDGLSDAEINEIGVILLQLTAITLKHNNIAEF